MKGQNMKKNIDTLLQEALDVCEDLNIEVGNIINIKWNNRLKSVWGRCICRSGDYRIELNPILAEEIISWEDAMNTVIHEVLHAHPDRFCHTGEWKKCANLVNRNFPIYHICRCTSAEEKGVADRMRPTANWKVTCMNCGYSCTYMRAGSVVKTLQTNPAGCRCGVCKSTDLKLTKMR